MPRVSWGIKAGDIDGFDRDKQYKPYDGPIPPNGVYQWQVKVLKYVAGTREKHPQLRIGLELVPRKDRRDERQYAGYFIMIFPPVTERTAFRYVPFLDALGVSGRDFEQRTDADQEGNIRRIGGWRNDGKQMIMAELKDERDQSGNLRKDIGYMGATDMPDAEDEETEYDEDEYADDEDGEEEDDFEEEEDDYEEEELEPAPKKRRSAPVTTRRTATRGTASRKTAPAKRTRRLVRDEDDF